MKFPFVAPTTGVVDECLAKQRFKAKRARGRIALPGVGLPHPARVGFRKENISDESGGF